MVPDVDRRRERAALALAAKQDSPGVLRLIAAWSAVGTPTVPAKVAEGEAFLNLRMVDKALSCAREAVGSAPSDRSAMRLLARVYIDRGWPSRARSVLDGLRSAGEDVEVLRARASAEPPSPEATARDVEGSGNSAAILQLAEQFMASGSLTRASLLLDRLGAANSQDLRVRDLRWALAGNYTSLEPVDLLVKRALPAILELTSVSEDADHTEALSDLAAKLLLDPDTGAAPFPTLFKSAPLPPAASQPVSPATEEEERTATSALPEASTPPIQLQNLTGATSGDTQILMVVGEGEVAGPMHRRRGEPSKTLNLREWQASMGVDPLVSDLDDVEDSEVMRLNVGDGLVEAAVSSPVPEPSHRYEAPIQVIEKHPVPREQPVLDDSAAERDPPTYSGHRGLRFLLGSFFVVGFVVVLGLLALLIARASGLLDGARAGIDLSRVLASSDYPALVEAEARLAEHSDQAAEAAELARARMVLWAEYDGDHELLEQVDSFLADPVGVDAHQVAYLRAAQLLAFRNPASALAAIGREPPGNDEERLLLARIHGALGDSASAMGHLGTITAGDEPRFRLGRGQVLLTLGALAEARAEVVGLVAEAPNLVAARLLELRLREGTAKERAAAAGVFRRTYRSLGLSPRQEGEAAWVEAAAWMEIGDRVHAVQAAEIGVARDGTHRDLLMLLAHEHVESGDLVGASRKLGSLLDWYRADLEVRRDLVLVDLDLDRVNEAMERAKGANPPMQGVLVALVHGWSGEGGAPDPATVDVSTPLGAWAHALLVVSGHHPNAAAVVATAAFGLAGSDDLMIHRLAVRADALAASLLPEPEAASRVAGLRETAMSDAAAHVFIGQYWERVGSRPLAAQHFDRAASLGPQLGLALYEKGRFYEDAGDEGERTTKAWEAYLALAPSGPRALRAR